MAQVWRSELDPVDFLRRAEVVYGPKIGLVHGTGAATRSGSSRSGVNRLASAPARPRACGQHDRVAVLSPNTPPMLEAHFGVPAAGCCWSPINTRLAGDEIGYILEHSGARFLFVDPSSRRWSSRSTWRA